MRTRSLIVTGLLLAPAMLAAQSGQSTARAVAMGRSMTASAQGYEAIVWNPALLGVPGRPKFSVNILQVGVATRSNVLSPSDPREDPRDGRFRVRGRRVR
jgi:long-subunit fatty acid transport protein